MSPGGSVILNTLKKWPVVRQIIDGGKGTGREAMSDHSVRKIIKH
jgi:hypothetical protein